MLEQVTLRTGWKKCVILLYFYGYFCQHRLSTRRYDGGLVKVWRLSFGEGRENK